jgi:hypothetical protein
MLRIQQYHVSNHVLNIRLNQCEYFVFIAVWTVVVNEDYEENVYYCVVNAFQYFLLLSHFRDQSASSQVSWY